MSSESLALYAGGILSLCFSYIPGLKSWFGELQGERKRLVMLAALILVAVAVAIASCANIPQLAQISCDEAGIVGLAKALVLAIIANQSIYAINPKK